MCQYLQFWIKSLKYVATKIWDIVPYKIKSVGNINWFKKKIGNLEPKGCNCSLSKQYLHGVGYVDTF